jgi:hypothetical protein
MGIMKSDHGNVTSPLLGGGQTELHKDRQNSCSAQTTSILVEGGFAHSEAEGGAAPQGLTFRMALISQPPFIQTEQMYVAVS